MTEEKSTPPPKKRSVVKLLIIIIATVTVLLLLAGGGLYYYKHRDTTPKFLANTVITGFMYARDILEDKQKIDSFFDPPSITLPKIQIPIMKENGVVATLKFRVIIKAKNNPIFEEIKFKLPYIIDSIFVKIFTLYSNLWIPSIEPNQEVLEEHVSKAVESVLDANKIDKLLIKDIFIEK